MNVTYLQSNADSLIDHMRAHGYSRSYIKKCRRVCNYVVMLSDELSWESYDDVRLWISANEDLSERYRDDLQFAVWTNSKNLYVTKDTALSTSRR